MTAAQLIAEFEIMLKGKWRYEWGAAKEGVVDCSGAFVYAMKKYSLSIYHGSNTIWRQYLTDKGKISSIGLVPGMAVFKWREDGEPEKFINDGQDDFYHIGLYVGGNRVLEAKGTKYGFVESTLKGWTHAGKIKGIDYGTEGGTPTMQTGYILMGIGTVNMRQGPGASYKLAPKNPRIPEGAEVTVLSEESGWAKVQYNGETGYVSSQYITADSDTTAPQPATDTVTLPLSRAAAKELYEALGAFFDA